MTVNHDENIYNRTQGDYKDDLSRYDMSSQNSRYSTISQPFHAITRDGTLERLSIGDAWDITFGGPSASGSNTEGFGKEDCDWLINMKKFVETPDAGGWSDDPALWFFDILEHFYSIMEAAGQDYQESGPWKDHHVDVLNLFLEEVYIGGDTKSWWYWSADDNREWGNYVTDSSHIHDWALNTSLALRAAGRGTIADEVDKWPRPFNSRLEFFRVMTLKADTFVKNGMWSCINIECHRVEAHDQNNVLRQSLMTLSDYALDLESKMQASLWDSYRAVYIGKVGTGRKMALAYVRACESGNTGPYASVTTRVGNNRCPRSISATPECGGNPDNLTYYFNWNSMDPDGFCYDRSGTLAEAAKQVGAYNELYTTSVTPPFLKDEKGLDDKSLDALNEYYREVEAEQWAWASRIGRPGSAEMQQVMQHGWKNSGKRNEFLGTADQFWYAYASMVKRITTTGLPSLPQNLQNDVDTFSTKTPEDIFDEWTTNAAWWLAYHHLHVRQSELAFKIFARFWIDEDNAGGKYDDWAEIDDLINDAKKDSDDAFEHSAHGANSRGESSEPLTEAEIEERQVYLKQCALLLNMDSLAANYRNKMVWEKQNQSPGRFIVHDKVTGYYNGKIHLLDCDNSEAPSEIVNKLIAPKYMQVAAFLESSPDIQSALVPKIRLFKVYNDDEGNLKEVEFGFPTHMNPKDGRFRVPAVPTSNYGGAKSVFRGGACGIKSFSWSFEGTTTATARNDIKATIELYFQDFNELVKKRRQTDIFGNDANLSQGHGEVLSFLDLILLPHGRQYMNTGGTGYHPNQYDPTHYRIRADVGWVVRNDQEFAKIVQRRNTLYGNRALTAADFNQALEMINKSFYLNMVEHNLDFKEDGSVEIKVDYRAYLESVMKTTALDALVTPEILREKERIRNEYNEIISKRICSENDYQGADGIMDENDEDALKNLIATYDALRDEQLKRSHQSILDRLIRRQRMFYCYLDADAADSFKSFGYFKKKPKLNWNVNNGINFHSANVQATYEEENQTVNGSRQVVLTFSDTSMQQHTAFPSRDQGELINFFYLGDIIHTVLDCMHEAPTQRGGPLGNIKPHLKQTAFLLSSFDYLDDQSTTRRINIAEIPVAAEYFFEWMTETVVKNKRKSYPITLFIRDLCNKLIVELMGETCLNRQAEKQMRFNNASLLSQGDNNPNVNAVGTLDPFPPMPHFPNRATINVSKAYRNSELPLKSNITYGLSIKDMWNYYLVYPITTILTHQGRGNAAIDGYKGVYHVEIGSSRGIIKRFKFEKTDIQFIREARYFNNGYDGLLQLGAVYKVTLDMFGNTLFFPGMEIFIDPRGIGGHTFDPTVGSSQTRPASIANALGVGGYHLVTRVQSRIAAGEFNTSVEAQFVYSGDGQSKSYAVGANQQITGSNSISIQSNDEIIGETVDQWADTFCDKITVVAQRRLRDLDDAQFDFNLTDSEARLDGIINN